jgi:hypothetical protein
MHVKAGGSGVASQTDWYRGRPAALTEPMLLSIVITKPLYDYIMPSGEFRPQPLIKVPEDYDSSRSSPRST